MVWHQNGFFFFAIPGRGGGDRCQGGRPITRCVEDGFRHMLLHYLAARPDVDAERLRRVFRRRVASSRAWGDRRGNSGAGHIGNDDDLRGAPGPARHARIAGYYVRAAAPDAYKGEFHEGPHRFDVPMQQAALAWLHSHLATARQPFDAPTFARNGRGQQKLCAAPAPEYPLHNGITVWHRPEQKPRLAARGRCHLLAYFRA